MDKRLEKLYAWGLITIFAGIVLHAPLSVWLGTIFPTRALLIKSWKEIIMLLLVPVAVWLVTRRRLWAEFSRDLLFRILITYALLYILAATVWWHGLAQTAAGLAIDLRYVLFFALVYTLLRIAPDYKTLMVKVAVGGAIIVLGFATAQLFLPKDILVHIGYGDQTIQPYLTVDKNPDFIRINSTLRGPNPLGAYAAAVFAVLAAFAVREQKRLKDKKLRMLIGFLTVAGGVALWMSYSRSAFVAAAIGIISVIVFARSKKLPPRWLVGGAAGALLVIIGLAFSWNSSLVQNVILHENPNGGSSVSSNAGHVSSLQVGVNQLLHQPLGAGIGSTGSASLFGTQGEVIENQYLFIAHESGWLGLGLYVGIFSLVMLRLFRRRRDWLALGVFGSGIALALIGLLLPVWVDDTVSIVWWGLAAVAIGGEYGKKRARQ